MPRPALALCWEGAGKFSHPAELIAHFLCWASAPGSPALMLVVCGGPAPGTFGAPCVTIECPALCTAFCL